MERTLPTVAVPVTLGIGALSKETLGFERTASVKVDDVADARSGVAWATVRNDLVPLEASLKECA
jgi:hypothetical protein